MSQGITHFAVGATVTVLLVTVAIPTVRYPRTWTLVGGGWALVPDASKLHAVPETLAFHDSILANVCWAHRTLDRLDPGDSTTWASAALLALFGATVLAERRSYRTPAPIAS
ncbi:hypothetical protein L593_13985 [Salinarchaeum sp. Harcht-Bsk1]|uniref:hypothetical protein n=1 Tax=Salinarchaeum sp. Harcht-Bsk1 TaxID=1333523 RepID=UPI0003422B6E|nr:hypothetical protein [Salinarchaeum sp. Harcht-Bsk1]AGN02736.1 hypothetical protein L593_13985 [Salinarchaeum sp. Harcht-Bsk1]